MLQYAFGELRMHRVWAVATARNLRSERLLRRAGFAHEGRMREAILVAGRYVDLNCFSILEGEYSPKSKPGEVSGQ
jgi:RimJ/RimL family protein N-acetyltransferase